MQYTMATHKVIQNIGHLLWGFTFDLFLPLINEFYLPNQMKILGSDINTENMN